MNKVFLIGNLGRDPEVRVMANQDQTVVANLAVATTKRGKDKEFTEWHRVSAFGKVAEIMRDYLTKGQKVMIEGELRTRDYMKDNIKTYSTEIICNNFEFLSPKGEASHAPAKQAAPTQSQPPAVTEDFEDDIPF